MTVYIIMLGLLVLLGLLNFAVADYHPIIYDYRDYLQAWGENKVETVNVSEFASKKQKCGENSCDYFYYIYESPTFRQGNDRNKTVFIVSGLRGNDYLGPAAVLNMFGKLAATRIIYLPIANPSGFNNKNRLTFPNKINIFEDFPMRGSQSCNQSSAVRILDQIYRKQQIDLTVYIQDGAPGFAYSWTGLLQKGRESVKQKVIYDYLFAGVRQIYTKQNEFFEKSKQGELKVKKQGNSFIDWAYGAFRFPDILTTVCNGQVYQSYQEHMMNGLAVGLSIGSLGDLAAVDDKSYQSFVIERAIKMVQFIVKFVNPEMEVKIESDQKKYIVSVKVAGCSSATLDGFMIYTKNETLVQGLTQSERIQGNQKQWKLVGSMEKSNAGQLTAEGFYQLSFACDEDWVGLGTTMFAQRRVYKQQGLFNITPKDNVIQLFPSKQNKNSASIVQIAIGSQNGQKTKQVKIETNRNMELLFMALKFIGLGIFSIFVFAFLVNCCQVGLAVMRTRGNKVLSQKFEKVEYVESTEYTEQENNLSPSVEMPQLSEPPKK